jgi:hypothetical protein
LRPGVESGGSSEYARANPETTKTSNKHLEKGACGHETQGNAEVAQGMGIRSNGQTPRGAYSQSRMGNQERYRGYPDFEHPEGSRENGLGQFSRVQEEG